MFGSTFAQRVFPDQKETAVFSGDKVVIQVLGTSNALKILFGGSVRYFSLKLFISILFKVKQLGGDPQVIRVYEQEVITNTETNLQRCQIMQLSSMG